MFSEESSFFRAEIKDLRVLINKMRFLHAYNTPKRISIRYFSKVGKFAQENILFLTLFLILTYSTNSQSQILMFLLRLCIGLFQ